MERTTNLLLLQVENFEEVQKVFEEDPKIWEPDGLFLLQEYIEHDTTSKGIIRMEFVGGEFLYAMRVVSGGAFNLCPSEVCNPKDRKGPQFFAYPEVWRVMFRRGGQTVN
eukprot:m.159286 g.159286  ORF g.159286 m.159286 type:complete len:110 (+) comp24789_c0_seq5:81-410(+)